MPVHLHGLDISADIEGKKSALVVACNMCAGASFAMKEGRPFLQLFKSFLKSPPLDRYVGKLLSQLNEKRIKAKWFRRGIIQQFFLCLWTRKQRDKFRKEVAQYESVVVLGCESAFKTVRDSVQGTDCKAIEGTEVLGIMNTKPKLRFPCDISFEDSGVAPACDHHCNK